MIERLLVTGAGGQGIILAGKILATAALEEVPHVTFFPDYGAEVRGGTSKCEVVLSGEPIASPVSDEFEAVIIMNEASAIRFGEIAKGSALVLVNASLCPEPLDGALAVDAHAVAALAGSIRSANFVMMGAYLARHPIVSAGSVETAVRAAFREKGEKIVEINLRAFRMGLEA